jgi:hypothetical protein
MKDEALKLALEALEGMDILFSPLSRDCTQHNAVDRARKTITAIKQALAAQPAPVQPVDGTQVSRVWWDGEKLMAKPIPLEDFYLPAPVQERKNCALCGEGEPFTGACGGGRNNPKALCFTPPAAQRQCNWPTCQSEEYQQSLAEQIKQELVTGAGQPAVPDAIQHTDLSEHPQYIEGWNDCRAEMLKGMKP